MMKAGHYAVAAPPATGMAWGMVVLAEQPVWVALGCAVLLIRSCTWPDLDHPQFKGRMHPGAALVRGSGHLGYMLRTAKDKDRNDVHRGPSHCVEWCLIVGGVFGLLTAQVPFIAPWAVWWGAAVAIGCVTHILADWPTPSGVPISAVYNWLVHGEVWRRHSLHWFSTDSAGEKFLAVPALYLITAVMVMGMMGILGRVVQFLGGWSW